MTVTNKYPKLQKIIVMFIFVKNKFIDKKEYTTRGKQTLNNNCSIKNIE